MKMGKRNRLALVSILKRLIKEMLKWEKKDKKKFRC
jgi:hypothetical protein